MVHTLIYSLPKTKLQIQFLVLTAFFSYLEYVSWNKDLNPLLEVLKRKLSKALLKGTWPCFLSGIAVFHFWLRVYKYGAIYLTYCQLCLTGETNIQLMTDYEVKEELKQFYAW